MKAKSAKSLYRVDADYSIGFLVTISADSRDIAGEIAVRELQKWIVRQAELSATDLHPAFGSNIIENLTTTVLSCSRWNGNEWTEVTDEPFPRELGW
jgi:hypothetical protein